MNPQRPIGIVLGMLLTLLLSCAPVTERGCLPVPPNGDCLDTATDSSTDSSTDTEPPDEFAAELVGKQRYYATIQEAITDADEGDVVLVQPGTHYEYIDFHGKGIRVTSDGADVTVLDGMGLESTVSLRGLEPETAVLENFTITNGQGTENHGGGVFVENADPIIQHNIIRGNNAAIGAGVYFRHGAATLRNNVVAENTGGTGGAGVTCTNCRGLIAFNTFYLNDAPDGSFGEWFFEVEGDLIGNVIVLTPESEFAIRFMEPKGYTFTVADNLLWPEVPWVDANHPDAADFPEDHRTIHDDPLFVDESAYDFHLSPTSPAVDVGVDGYEDVDGSPADLGAYGGPYGEWP